MKNKLPDTNSDNDEPTTIPELMDAMAVIVNGAENRSLSDDEVTTYEGLETRLKAAQKTSEIQKRMAAYEAPRVSVLPSTQVKQGRDSYEFAFDQYLRGVRGASEELTFAQSEGTTTAGGFLVPTTTRDVMIEVTKAFGGIATVAETITTAQGNPYNWPVNDDTANVGVGAAEGAAPGSGGADLVLSQITLSAYKMAATGTGQAGLKVSKELLQDSAFDVTSFVTRKMATRLARGMATWYATGTGTTMPVGLFDKAGDASQLTSGVITYVGLVKILHLLDPSYRLGAHWLFNDDVASRIEQIVDTTGRPILIPSTQGVMGPTAVTGHTLLGYPVTIDQAAPAWISTYAAAVNTAFLCFGDISQAYIIRNVQGVSVEMDPITLMSTNQVQYFGYARTDGNVQNRKAYVLNG